MVFVVLNTNIAIVWYNGKILFKIMYDIHDAYIISMYFTILLYNLSVNV
jgi:hypothetical protein